MGQTQSYIDLVFLPKGWAIVKAKSMTVCFSDHCFSTIKAEMVGQPERGRGVWKLNVSLLDDGKTQKQFRQHYIG